MISFRYVPAICALLAIALVPTLIHSYGGPGKGDGLSTASIPAELAGYKVVFVPFKNGRPAGKPEDFLTGFIADAGQAEVYGRPVGVTVLPDGSMLVADDASNTLWRISVRP